MSALPKCTNSSPKTYSQNATPAVTNIGLTKYRAAANEATTKIIGKKARVDVPPRISSSLTLGTNP